MERARLLIIMANTGSGHRSAAQAIAQALQSRGNGALAITITDLFALGEPTFLDRLSALYGPMIRHTPRLWGLFYHATNHPGVFSALYRGLAPRVFPQLQAHLQQARPDLFLSVHPLANRITAQALDTLGWRIPRVAVLTDLTTFHVSWAEPALDVIVTPTPEASAALVALGLEPAKIRCLGLPIDVRFARRETEPEETLRGLGLLPNRFTLLLMGGGEGAGDLSAAVQALGEANLELQLIVVCGRNETLRRRLAGQPLPVPAAILGYSQEIPRLMQASQLLVTKAGPHTIAEALASHLPLIVTGAVPGQEEGNLAFVRRHELGYVVHGTAELVAALRRLASAPELRERLAANCARLARPQAALEIAELLLSLLPSHTSRKGGG